MSKPSRSYVVKLKEDGIYSANTSGEEVKIAEPIIVTAFAAGLHGREKDQAYTEVKFRDRYGEWKREVVLSCLLSAQRRDFIKLLANRGYVWPPNDATWPQIIGALSCVKPPKHFYVTSVPGWHEGISKAFVLPGGSIAKEPADRKSFRLCRTSTVHLGDFAVHGTLQDWQEKIGKVCRQSSGARLAVAAPFAAPNLRLFKLDSFGFNFSGKSSSGKTLLIRLAASVAGLNGAGGPATWDGSPVGFEQRALGHRDCVMPLDDVSHLEGDATKLAKLVTFRLASNKPKARAGQYVDANRLVEVDWRVIPLSTSEDPLWRRHARSQRAIRGEEVRLVDIPACVSKMDDVFDGPLAGKIVGATLNRRVAFVEQLEELSRQQQGTPFRAYLKRQLRDPDAEKVLKQHFNAFLKAVPLPDGARALGRIRRYFAVVYASAAQAIDYGILPWKKKATLRDLKRCMVDAMDQLTNTTSDFLPTRPDDEHLIREFAKRLSEAKFIDPSGATAEQLTLAAGVKRRRKSGKVQYLLYAKTMDRWFPDLTSRKRLTAALCSRGLIKAGRRADTRTLQTKLAALGKRLPCYRLRRKKVLAHVDSAK